MAEINQVNPVLGAGKIYIVEYAGSIPADTVIETEANKIGHTSGGFSINYTFKEKIVKNDLDETVDTYVTEEEATIKTGVLRLNPKNFSQLCQRAVIAETADKITVKFGGIGNDNSKSYLIRFVHVSGVVKCTVIGKANTGFEIAYTKDKETIVDMTFRCLSSDTAGTLIQLDYPKGYAVTCGNVTGTVATAIATVTATTTVPATVVWSAVGLPTGLTISSTTGAITGTVATATTVSVIVTATNSTDATKKASKTIYVTIS